MNLKKFYKYNDSKAFETLYEVISWEGDRGGYSKAYDDWVEGQAKAYLEIDYDGERLHKLFWDMESLRLIDIFKFEKIDVEKLWDGFDRKDLKKLVNKYKGNEQAHLKLLELQKAFDDDFKGKREQWASERANDDYSCFISDIDTKDDKQVADFFNISDEVTAYEGNTGDEYQATEVIGFCGNCSEPITKERLFAFNDNLIKPEDIEPDHIGYCANCENGLYACDITDKEMALVVNI